MTLLIFVFFNDTATTEIYTLSLHDALPISAALPGGDDRRAEPVRHPRRGLRRAGRGARRGGRRLPRGRRRQRPAQDRKSTRLNSSHANISYAVFCLKKKKIIR